MRGNLQQDTCLVTWLAIFSVKCLCWLILWNSSPPSIISITINNLALLKKKEQYKQGIAHAKKRRVTGVRLTGDRIHGETAHCWHKPPGCARCWGVRRTACEVGPEKRNDKGEG